MEWAELRHVFAGNETRKMPCCYGYSSFHIPDFCQVLDVIFMVYLIGKINNMQTGLACPREKEDYFVGKEKIDNGKIPDSEKEAAIGLLITVFDIHDREKALYKALNDFSIVYGGEISGWLQHLYDYLHKSGNKESKLDVIRDFAEQHKIELKE